MTLPELALKTRAQWNESHGPYFKVHDSTLYWNLNQQNLVTYKVAEITSVPIVYGVAAENGVSAGLPTRNFWLSLWGNIPAGKEDLFVKSLLELAKLEKKEKVIIGADEFHHVPGVPLPTGEALIGALKRVGFQGAIEADFIGEVKSSSVTDYIRESEKLAKAQSLSLVPLKNQNDHAKLHAFLAKEFPGRWTREFEFWSGARIAASADPSETKRGLWMSLMRESNTLVGFARLAVRGQGKFENGWTPGALRLPLSNTPASAWLATDGCLGPIGVAASERGKGAGKALLGLVLRTLRDRGAERICIDWTDAIKYYEPLHFEKAREYWNAWK
jgi:GNAT superfamily N-acetyltransferase